MLTASHKCVSAERQAHLMIVEIRNKKIITDRERVAAMLVAYEPWLVLLSIVMAIQGAYVGFSLAVQIGGAVGTRRRLLLAGAAFSLAVAIWTMHFVGMLATRLPFSVDYLVFPTLLSFLVCVIVVGTAVFAISAGPLTWVRLKRAPIWCMHRSMSRRAWSSPSRHPNWHFGWRQAGEGGRR